GGTSVLVGASGGTTTGTNNTGATPSATAGNATLVIKGNYTITGRMSVTGGNRVLTSQGTLSLVDGTINTLTLSNDTYVTSAGVPQINQTLTFGGSTTRPSNLNVELGAQSDQVVVGAGTA